MSDYVFSPTRFPHNYVFLQILLFKYLVYWNSRTIWAIMCFSKSR
jgi:hypothetical protein